MVAQIKEVVATPPGPHYVVSCDDCHKLVSQTVFPPSSRYLAALIAREHNEIIHNLHEGDL